MRSGGMMTHHGFGRGREFPQWPEVLLVACGVGLYVIVIPRPHVIFLHRSDVIVITRCDVIVIPRSDVIVLVGSDVDVFRCARRVSCAQGRCRGRE